MASFLRCLRCRFEILSGPIAFDALACFIAARVCLEVKLTAVMDVCDLRLQVIFLDALDILCFTME